ncbi:hypothetical protein [Micromonospora sp. NPDC049645]|uniref:hypothetical protein n=1 Tax=Micromonospora sp. NPDC049645 TaxID=3155508 RepID=UPI003415A418
MSEATCLRAARGGCDGRPTFALVFRGSTSTEVTDTEGPFCFGHGMAEIDRALAAASMARVDLEPVQPDRLPVCLRCAHRHAAGDPCAGHVWGDTCEYNAGADCPGPGLRSFT